jgi:hypothetical protein
MRPIFIMKLVAPASGGSGSYAGGSLDTQTVTSGASGTAGAGNRRRGFITGSLGSVNDGTSNLYSGAAIRELASEENSGFDVILIITGVQSNSGWTSMNVGGNHVLTRASATFSTAGGNSSWTWAGVGNLFGSASSVIVVGFD